MPLPDIAIAQCSFQNNACTLGAQTFIQSEFVFGNHKRLISTWKFFQIPNKAKKFSLGHIETHGSRLSISAIATLEQKYAVQSNDRHKSRQNSHSVIDQRIHVSPPQFSSEDSEEVEEREKLRRQRISKANKGNTPWNKGRKHSAETLQRIKERTWLAMQNPKVKMKLVNLGHAQTKETRLKIAIGVREGWERRREKLMIQESCHFEWQNLIAEASRSGSVGEEEFQWDSYKTLDKEFELEWLESVEKRKNMVRPKGSKKGPQSPEQRRKISEAISAKWAEPGYRDRVFSALSKYHGTPVGLPRKVKRKPIDDRITLKRSIVKKTANDKDNYAANEAKSQIHRPRLRESNVPLYKDPLAGSKLEMIKNIRAQRASSGTKKTETIERARLLIGEAEKAAKALEVSAMKSPLAQASLIETRKLIAEAIQSIKSIGLGQVRPHEIGANHVGIQKDAEIEGQSKTENKKVNGFQALKSSESNVKDSSFGNEMFNFQDLFDGKDELLPPTSFSNFGPLNGNIVKLDKTGFRDYGLSPSELDDELKQSSFTKQPGELRPNGSVGEEKRPLPNGAKVEYGKKKSSSNSITVTKKKWVRGKLVELAEEDSD